MSGTPRDRRGFKAVAAAILFSGAAVAYSGIPRLGLRPPVIITAAFIFAVAIALAWIAAFCKTLVILENAMIIPFISTNFKPRASLPLSEISEIRLNTEVTGFKPDVEIITTRGKTVKIPKTLLTNWRDFYRVLTEDLRGKVRVTP
jgi:hypothetical protein